MTAVYNQATLSALMRLREVITSKKRSRPDWFRKAWGLCGNFGMLRHEMAPDELMNFKHLFSKHYPTWPHYSGDLAFPVPGGELGPAPYAYDTMDDLYDQQTEYGRLRLELLDYIINIVENDLHDSTTSPS